MKKLIFPVVFFLLFTCFNAKGQDEAENSLNCAEYWASVRINDFCGLAAGAFDFNTIPVDICNADQNGSYRFDDTVSIRVYNHFTEAAALEEYNTEEADAMVLGSYLAADDVGDDGFAIITVQFGKLDSARVLTVKGTFTVSVEVNGQTHIGAHNCFDKDTVLEFAKALVEPL